MRAVVVVAVVACVEYPRYECDTYVLNLGADAAWTTACDVTIAGTSDAHIHVDGVIAVPTFDGSTPACSIPPDTFESVACSSDDVKELACTRTCTTLWISSSDPSVTARFSGVRAVNVVCDAKTQDFSREVVFPECPM